ncbi:MAG TPA: BsuPI-related putative proteinase inhibitor [Myxococcaceae bacterium]|nr:BsuPI-related putative proteinase inhibitor [Myxococcaceae bacterium]
MTSGKSSASWSLLFALALGVVMAPFANASADPLQYTLTPSKSDYLRGEQAQFTLTVKNTSSNPVVVTFTSGQKYDFSVRDANGITAWTWSQGRVFSPLPSQQTLAPGASLSFTETWTFTTNLGQALADGAYTVRGTFTGTYVGKGSGSAEQGITYFTPDYLQVAFSADKSTYERGEVATLTLTMTNTAPYALTVSFATSQQYDFAAVDAAGNTMWNWSAGRIFDPVPSSRTLAPGETWSVQETWNFRDSTGAKVPDGDYTVSGALFAEYQGRDGTKGGSQTVHIQTTDPIRVAFSTDKTTYGRLDKAKLTLRVTNVATYPVTVQFPNAQLYEFTANTPNGFNVWTWSRGKTFSPSPVELIIAPDETVQFQETWALVDNNGLPVSDGTYKMTGTFLGNYFGKPGPKTGSVMIQVSPLP